MTSSHCVRANVLVALAFAALATIACKGHGEAGSTSSLDSLAGHEKRETKYDNG